MGTHKTDTSTNAYNPAGLAAYNSMQPGLANTTNQYMTNPFGNPFMQTQQQMGTRQAQNIGGTQMSGLANNLTTSGMMGGQSSPAALEMMQNQGRANSGMQANLGFLGPMQNALGMQQNAMGLANSYRPLQTGQTQQESTGGLGTWLPQLLSGGIGALMGMPGMGGGGPFSGAGMQRPSSMTPFNASGYQDSPGPSFGFNNPNSGLAGLGTGSMYGGLGGGQMPPLMP